MIELFFRPRRLELLLLTAVTIGVTYVLITFELKFLLGRGPFWAYPVGPWLMDSADAHDNVDMLDYLVAYTGFIRAPWTYPLFYVGRIGAPLGTSVVFLDVIPVAALAGRLVSAASGSFFLPYGAWVGLCFILSPLCATLMLFEVRQRSFLAAASASIFAVSAPTLMHRFGHLPLMAHFLIIGALYLYLREQRPLKPLSRLVAWLAWLSMALLTNAYIVAMVSMLYAAALLRSWRVQGLRGRFVEPAIIISALLMMLPVLGFVGSDASLSAPGFGYYSMNLLSPITPQRSGLFTAMNNIVDSTGGQYEGFSYFGCGGLIIIVLALFFSLSDQRRAFVAHRELVLALLLLSAYAVSNQVWYGSHKLFEIDLGHQFSRLVGIFRSSGRMFWPAYYALLLGSLILVMKRLPRIWAFPVVAGCCLLQLVDSEPLRARMTLLSGHGGTPVLNQQEWADRIKPADFVQIYPAFFCSDEHQMRADMELQLLSISADKSFNVSYNPRHIPDCNVEAKRLLEESWKSTTLYVFLNGATEAPRDWSPPGLACSRFAEGQWCLGPQNRGEPAQR